MKPDPLQETASARGLSGASAPQTSTAGRLSETAGTRLRALLGGLGLRARLMLLLALAITPMTVLVGSLLWLEYDQTLDRAKGRLRDAAELAAADQSGVFDEARATLGVLQAVPQIRAPGSFSECSAIVSALKGGNANFNTVGAIDAHGMLTCHSSLKLSQMFGDVELLDRARAPGAPDFLVGHFVIGRASGKPTVVTMTPIRSATGDFAGAVFASLNLERLSAAAETLSDGGRKVVAMIEPGSSRMLARYPPLPIPYGTPFPDHPLVRAMRDAPSGGVVETPGLDDVDRVYGFAPLHGVGGAGIMLAVGETRGPLLAPVRWHLVVSLSFLGGVFLIASLCTWWFGYWTHLRPINRLRRTAEQIGAGRHDARATLEAWQAPELRLFGHRLEEMALRLADGRKAEQAVAESYRYLKIAERLAHVGYWQFDPASGRSTWSDEVFQIHEMPISAEPPSFDVCVAACHEDDRQTVRSTFAKAIDEGADFEIQIRLVRPSGEVRHVLSRACVETNEEGTASLIYGALLDITDLKRAELEAQAANAMLLMAEAVSEVGHWRLDLRSGALAWSEQVYRIHGYEPDGYTPLLETAILSYHPEDRDDVSRVVAAAIEQKQPYEFQKRILRPDGTVREVISRGRCEIDPASGDVVAVFGVIMDVTLTTRAERELQAKSALLEATLDTMDQGLVMIGTDGRLDVSNRRFAELLDVPDHLLKDPRPDFEEILLHLGEGFEEAGGHPDAARDGRARGGPYTPGIDERRHPNGRILEVRTVPLANDGGIVRTYTDVSDQRAAETGLRESELRYRLLVENASDMIFKLDRGLVRTYVSPASREILGYVPEDLVGRAVAEMAHPDEAARVAGVYDEVLNGLERTDITSRVRHAAGHWVWVEVELRALRDPSTNEVTGILGALRDVSERKQAEEQVAASEARFRMLSENTADLVTHVDGTGRRIFASQAASDLLGYEPEELIGGRPIDLAYPEDRPALDVMLTALGKGAPSDPVQYRARRKNGEYLWIEASGRPLGPEKGYILALRDIDRRKQVEDALEMAVLRLDALANLDGLTGLANRRRFDETLEREVARAARSATPISLLLADVDHFKAFNDTYGHPAGDACLRSVAEVLAGVIRRPGDLSARYGGEEFAAVLPDTDAAGALAVAEIFRRAVAASDLKHERSVFGVVTVSVGIVTMMPHPGLTKPSDVLEAADNALYRAKNGGRNCVRFCESLGVALAQAG